MTMTTTQFTNIADNIAKSLVDIETALISTPSSTVTSITNGQSASSNSLIARSAAPTDADSANLPTAAASAAAAVTNLATLTKAKAYAAYKPYLATLEASISGGMAEFCRANSLQVHPEFAAAVNDLADDGNELGLIDVFAPPQIFIASGQTLASIAVTGSAAGTFAAGTDIDTSLYGACPLSLKNTAGAPTTGTATSFTVTYIGADGASHTVTKALSGALGAGSTLALNVSGTSVTNIVVNSGGANTDAIAVVAAPTRTVAY